MALRPTGRFQLVPQIPRPAAAAAAAAAMSDGDAVPNKERPAHAQRQLILALTGQLADVQQLHVEEGDDFSRWSVEVDTERFGATPLIAVMRSRINILSLLPSMFAAGAGSGPEDAKHFPAEAARIQSVSPCTIDLMFTALWLVMTASCPVDVCVRTLEWLLDPAVTPVKTLDLRGQRPGLLHSLMTRADARPVFMKWIEFNLSDLAQICCSAVVEDALSTRKTYDCFSGRVVEWMSELPQLSGVRFRLPGSTAEFHPVVALAVRGCEPTTDADSDWRYSDAAIPLPPKYALCFSALFATAIVPINLRSFRAFSPETLLAVNPVTRSDFIEYICANGQYAYAHILYRRSALSVTHTGGIPPWKLRAKLGTAVGGLQIIAHDGGTMATLRSMGEAALLRLARAVRIAVCDNGRLCADTACILLEYLVLPLDLPYHDPWVREVRDLAVDLLSTATVRTASSRAPAAAAASSSSSAVVLKPVRAARQPRAKRMRQE